MPARKASANAVSAGYATKKRPAQHIGQSRHLDPDKLKDEVYRQMFRLEAQRPGAELGLAVALLRSWIAPASGAESAQWIEWLNKVCPICLRMIEAARSSESDNDCVRPMKEGA